MSKRSSFPKIPKDFYATIDPKAGEKIVRGLFMTNRVIVYGADWCGPCKKVKGKLDAAEVPYLYYNIDELPTAKAHAAKVQGSIPLVELHNMKTGGSLVVGGCEDTEEVLDIIEFFMSNT
jgi:glutaredoxin